MAKSTDAQVIAETRARYAESHRRYHDTRHLDAVLRHIDELAGHTADIDAVRWAALFHDAVYVIGADDNEARSAALAVDLLTAHGVPGPRVDEVARLVELTATHAPSDGDVDGAVLCDADLAVLGGSPGEYARYAADVRAEWTHIDEAAFALGRSKILASLLERPHLFHTATGRERWETIARHNIGVELGLLSTRLSN